MDSRQRTSHEQFTLLLEFMETHGDLSRPISGLQGKQKSEQLWQELTNLLNSVGGSGITKTSDKWKRVWSDWKTKKKGALINRDIHGTGGGPSKGKPLTPLEERILRVMGIASITGQVAIEEAGFEVTVPLLSERSGNQVERILGSPIVDIELAPAPSTDIIPVEGLSGVQARVYSPLAFTTPLIGPSNSRPTQQGGSPVSSMSSPRRAHHTRQLRRSARQGPFDRATSEFVAIEQSRLRLEKERLRMDKERVELERERLKVETERIRVEERRMENECLLRETIIQFNNNVTGLFLRFAPLFEANRNNNQ